MQSPVQAPSVAELPDRVLNRRQANAGTGTEAGTLNEWIDR